MSDIYNKAKELCATANTDQPFMCLDVSYIYILLRDGYDLRPKTAIKVTIFSFFGFDIMVKSVLPKNGLLEAFTLFHELCYFIRLIIQYSRGF